MSPPDHRHHVSHGHLIEQALAQARRVIHQKRQGAAAQSGAAGRAPQGLATRVGARGHPPAPSKFQ